MKHGLILHVQGQQHDSLAGPVQIAMNARAQLADVHIEIVLQGPIVANATRSAMPDALLENASNNDVRVTACANSLRGRGIAASDLARGVVTVPAAVAYLAECQWAGWAYVRV